MNMRCADGQRHTPAYHNGELVTRDGPKLVSTCQRCQQMIRRAHRRSAWWGSVEVDVEKQECVVEILHELLRQQSKAVAEDSVRIIESGTVGSRYRWQYESFGVALKKIMHVFGLSVQEIQ